MYDDDYIVRGLPKTKDWIGWTDGLSLITGVKIPFVVLHFNFYYPITMKDAAFELKRNYRKFGEEPEVSLIPTPLSGAIINEDGLILDYTRLDYYEIMFKFGLSKTHTITYDDHDRIHIYDFDRKFIGFFGIYNHRVWKDMLGVRIPYEVLAEQFAKEK